jgi:hypothetical protein
LAFYEQSVILRYSRPGARKTGLCMNSWAFIPCLLYDSTAGAQEAATVPRTIQQLEHKKLRQKLLPCLLCNPTAETQDGAAVPTVHTIQQLEHKKLLPCLLYNPTAGTQDGATVPAIPCNPTTGRHEAAIILCRLDPGNIVILFVQKVWCC